MFQLKFEIVGLFLTVISNLDLRGRLLPMFLSQLWYRVVGVRGRNCSIDLKEVANDGPVEYEF